MNSRGFIITLALALGAFIWLIDGLMDYLFFFSGRGSLVELLFTSIPNHEIYIRSLIMLCFLAFGLVTSALYARVQKARKETEESEKWLYTTLRSIGDGVIATDSRGKVTLLNRAAEEMTGWSLEEARGLPLTDVFHIVDSKTRERQANPVDKVLQTGKVVSLANNTLLISKNGRELQIADSAAGILDSLKNISGVVLAFRDVTNEYQAREELLRSEEKFRVLFEFNPTGLALLDTSTQKFIQTNRSYQKIAGYGPDEIKGITIKELSHPDDWESQLPRVKAFFDQSGQKTIKLVKRYLRKDGQVRWVRVQGEILHLSGGKAPLAFTSVEDITVRKQAQDDLKEREERLRILFEQAADAIYVCDSQGRMVEVNQAACRDTGYSKEELLQLNVKDVDVEIGTPKTLEQYLTQKGRTNPVTIQSRHRKKHGSTYPVEITIGSFEASGSLLHLGIARDISQRLANELTYGEILKTSQDGFLAVDRKGRLLDCNPAAAEMLGYSVGEMHGKSIFEFEAKYSRQELYRHLLNIKKTGSDLFETSFSRRDGSILAVEVSISYLPLEQGRFIAFVRNITRRRQAEKSIIESEERLHTILENLAAGVFVHDLDGKITMVNQAACSDTGYSESELLSMTVHELDWSSLDRNDREHFWRNLSLGKTVEMESNIRRKDGGEYPAEIKLSVFTLRGKPLILAMAQNITERKEAEKEKTALEDQLRQAQKMEAVGTLAGGIAHDFNNILSAITGYSELALDGTGEGRSASAEIQQVLKAAERARKLVQQILAFSRKGAMETKPLNLNSVIAEASQILERTLPKMIELKISPAGDLKLIFGDPNQLEQMILNLASNAQAAMPEGGRLSIKTINAGLDDELAAARLGLLPGLYVELLVTDTGVGMEPEVMEHMFEPFFTTKETGKGTGLGLASVYGIVKSHDGHIFCESRQGNGCTFHIYLPAITSEAVSAAENRAERVKEVQGGKETVLLVDDEDPLRNVATRFLEKKGYRVVSANSGEQALEIYRRQGDNIDLVIMDLNMPGMGGQRAIREIHTLRPEAKIIIASGYASNGQQCKITENIRDYIAKPFRRQELLLSVRRVLDSDEASFS